MRMIFSTVRFPQLPAFTVESLAITATGRPSMVPRPVTTPSAGSSGSCALARAPSSSSEPSSRSSRSRSRAKSFPCSAFFWWYFSAPPLRTRASSRSMRTSGVTGVSSLAIRSPSLSGEHGLPLLGEGLERLQAVLGLQAVLVHRVLVGERLVEIEVQAPVDGALRLADGDRRVPGHRLRHLHRHLAQPPRGGDPREEPHGERLGGAHAPASQDEVLGAGHADGTGEPHRAAGAGDDAQPDLGKAHLGPLDGDAQIAG